MSDTPKFAMPLLDAAQAQKHVTVNEALSRADALAAGRVERRDLAAPPASAADGETFIVGQGATGEWAGQDGALALYLNGGWEFVAPWEGAAFWVAAERLRVTRDGGAWVEGRAAGSWGGAATLGRVIELDQALSGASVTTAALIPDKAVVLGVTGRVIEAIGGRPGGRWASPAARAAMVRATASRQVHSRTASPGSRRHITAGRRWS